MFDRGRWISPFAACSIETANLGGSKKGKRTVPARGTKDHPPHSPPGSEGAFALFWALELVGHVQPLAPHKAFGAQLRTSEPPCSIQRVLTQQGIEQGAH